MRTPVDVTVAPVISPVDVIAPLETEPAVRTPVDVTVAPVTSPVDVIAPTLDRVPMLDRLVPDTLIVPTLDSEGV